jgi:myotubularin-related protein 5/13
VEGSEWLNLLQNVMQLAGAVTDLMDLQGSSVMLCLEDGWDLTCQVSSLAQLSLDPYYRTIQVSTILQLWILCLNLQTLTPIFVVAVHCPY